MNTYTKRGRGCAMYFSHYSISQPARSGRLECNEHDLGMRPHAQRRTPSPSAPIGKDEHPAETVQTVYVPAIYAGGDPGARRELPAVRMPAKLERNSRFLSDGQPVWCMYQQNA